MTQNNRSDKYFRELWESVNTCITDDSIEECFNIIKIYIIKNYESPKAQKKIDEIVGYQARHSRIKANKRTQQVTIEDYEYQLSALVSNIQEFVKTLKPEGILISEQDLFSNPDSKSHNWNFSDSFLTTIVFQKGFGLLDLIFKEFVEQMKLEHKIRVNRYLFEDGRLISIDESHYDLLDDIGQASVNIDYMDWKDGVIIQKKDKGFVLAEAFVIYKEETIQIWTWGSPQQRSKITIDTLNWFKDNIHLGDGLKEPFTVHIPFSNLDILQFPTQSNFEN